MPTGALREAFALETTTLLHTYSITMQHSDTECLFYGPVLTVPKCFQTSNTVQQLITLLIKIFDAQNVRAQIIIPLKLLQR